MLQRFCATRLQRCSHPPAENWLRCWCAYRLTPFETMLPVSTTAVRATHTRQQCHRQPVVSELQPEDSLYTSIASAEHCSLLNTHEAALVSLASAAFVSLGSALPGMHRDSFSRAVQSEQQTQHRHCRLIAAHLDKITHHAAGIEAMSAGRH